MRRWAFFLAGLAASLAVTLALWAAGVPGFFLFMAVPFLLFPFSSRAGLGSSSAGRPSAPCPSCGAPRVAGHRFCPSCGSRFP